MAGSAAHQPKDGEPSGGGEPPRFPEERRNAKGHGSSRVIPDAVIVAANDPEGIAARAQMVVIGHATGAGIGPLLILTFEFVFELIQIRRAKTKGSVMKFQFAPGRG